MSNFPLVMKLSDDICGTVVAIKSEISSIKVYLLYSMISCDMFIFVPFYVLFTSHFCFETFVLNFCPKSFCISAIVLCVTSAMVIPNISDSCIILCHMD